MNPPDQPVDDHYHQLAVLHRRFHELLSLLRQWQDGGLLGEELGFHMLRLKYLQSAITLDLLEACSAEEQETCARLNAEIRERESETHDPDDVYLEVVHRERERAARGLPPRVRMLREFEPEPTTTVVSSRRLSKTRKPAKR